MGQVVIDFNQVNVIAILRLGENQSKIVYKSVHGAESAMYATCSVDNHNQLVESFKEFLKIS